MYDFVDKLRRFLASLLLSLVFSATICGQEALVADLDMEKTSYSWLSVMSGTSVSRPLKSSYGWINFTDGKMADAFTPSGKVLWQKPLPAAATAMAAVDKDDFVFAVLRNKRLCLLNPSGLVLWQKPLDFEPKRPPLAGRDGRVYIFGKSAAASFGMNGIQKWKLETAELSQSASPALLDDGSLLLFYEALEDGKTAALRISPFSESLEKIHFAGKVTGAYSVDSGVLLVFSDGAAGLCSVGQSGEAQSKWAIKDLGLGEKTLFCPFSNGAKAVLATRLSQGTKAFVLDCKKGAVESAFFVEGLAGLETLQAGPLGVFVADSRSAVLCAPDGKKIRGATFPTKTKRFNWDHALFGANGNLILTSKNWSFAGWRFVMASEKSPAPQKAKGLGDFAKGVGDDHARIALAATEGRKARLEKGLYGADEKLYLHDSDRIMAAFFEKIMSQKSRGGSIAGLDSDELFSFSISQETAVISMLSLFGTESLANLLARVLNASGDESVLTAAFKAVQLCGYDPNGLIMEAIERLSNELPKKQEALLQELCRALYSVCAFMGRPAIAKRGLRILSNFQLPQYPDSTKEEARKIYEKLAKLQL